MGFSDVIEALAEDSGAMGNRCRSVPESLFQWVCAGNQRIRSLTTALNLRLPNLRKVMTVAYYYHLPVLVVRRWDCRQKEICNPDVQYASIRKNTPNRLHHS